MQELVPGVFHWTAAHPKIGIEVSCHLVSSSATVIDPLLPAEGIEWFDQHNPARVVLSNRHHLRHAEQIAERYECPIHCHEAGLHEFDDGPHVEGFSFGDTLAPGLRALEMDSICAEDTVLHIDAADGVLLFADSVINHGEIGFVSDNLIGQDPEGVKRRIVANSARLLDEDFDHLLFAHGTPLVGGGKEALRSFVERAGA
jgi:hypothetical protein